MQRKTLIRSNLIHDNNPQLHRDERNFLNIIKAIYQKPIDSIFLNGKN